MNFPFTHKWILSKCFDYCYKLKVKGSNYKNIRNKIRKLCSFFIFKIPINNIVVLKNYYSKNTIIICIKSIFDNKKIIFIIKKDRKTKHYIKNKKFNIFEEYKNGID